MEAPPAGDDLPQARPAREPEELPTRPVHPGRWDFEYYAVATNLPLALPALYAFIGGLGAQEKTIAELKGEFARMTGNSNRVSEPPNSRLERTGYAGRSA